MNNEFIKREHSFKSFFPGGAARAVVFVFLALFGAASAARAAVFTVTNVNDSGAGSLRQAIAGANALPNEAHTINFNIGTGLKTINLASPLPAVATFQDVTIDGTTQGGFANVPLIELNGAAAGASAHGLYFYNAGGTMGAVTVKGLIINRFSRNGIRASNVRALNVYDCYVGTDAAGSTDLGNALAGIFLTPANGAAVSNIGGAGANQRNVISGNNGAGVEISGYYPAEVRVANNYIGTNASGVIDVGNAGDGVDVFDYQSPVTRVVIGGALPEQRNLISGNNKNGVRIGIADAVTVQGNYIGLGANGLTAIGNSEDGVNYSLEGETGGDVLVGGAASGAGNTIAANGGDGVEVYYYDQLGLGTIAPVIVGNRIGTDYNGTAARPNAGNGVLVGGLAAPVIGRENAGEGNTIAGNGGSGIYLSGATASIAANRIGLTSLGGALGNTNAGIYMTGAYGVQIGKEGVAAAGNLIGANGAHGVAIAGGAQGFGLFGNLIGTNALGQNLGNVGSGVFVTDAASAGRIGAAGSGNTIAFNTVNGITLKQAAGSANAPNGVSFVGNAIHSNSSLGIDLGANGVTANDPLDADAGPNELQNFPVIDGASPAQVNGTLGSTPNKTFRIDFYRVDACDAGGYGEGRYHVGSTDVTTDANGAASFIAANVTLATGQIVTATATRKYAGGALESTSEFSACRTVAQPPGNLALGAAAYAVNEGAGTATVTVVRTNGTLGAIGVSYATANGTASAGADYAATSGTLAFQSGETSKSFTVPILDDQSDEPNETFTVQLSNPTGGAALVAPSSATVTIGDNDGPPAVSAATVQLAEGNEATTPFVFDVTLSQPSAFPVTVSYQTADGTANAGVDYSAASGSLSFAPGETAKQVTVQVKGDATPEIDEAFALQLFGAANATVGGDGTGIVLDDDNPGRLRFSAAAYSVSEGAPSALVTVTRENGAAGTVSVDYAAANGTATAGSDYAATSGTLQLAAGQTSATFAVPLIDDAAGESPETVFLTLANPLGGATLGAPSSATLTIADDDGGLPASVSIAGRVTKNDLPLAGVAVTLAGAQAATVVTGADGRYAFANLAAGGSYLVTPTFAGHAFEPGSLSYSGLAADQTAADFAATTAPARRLRVAAADAQPAATVVVPVELTAQGNENAVGFSLAFDANLLYNAQVALGADAAGGSLVFNTAQAGRVGVLVALPAGQSFAPGARRVASVTFQTAPTALYSTPVEFAAAPVAGEISDANANPLPAAFENGVVTFAHGFEADVAPRPTGTGNGSVTVADFTQVGKFVAGTAAADQLNEFQRADAAPRGTKGNGALTVSDYAQAGRYAAGLDAPQTAGGPTAALSAAALGALFERQNAGALAANGLAAPRAIRVVSTAAAPGQTVAVAIELEAQGDENAAGFTLNYDAAKLSAPVVALGGGAAGATLIPNTLQAGRVGVVIGMPAGQTFAAGTRQLVTISFHVAANAAGGPTPLAFGDAPVFREVVNADADVLATAFNDGALSILVPTAAAVSVAGRVTDGAGRPVARALVTLADAGGATRTAFTNQFGSYRFAELRAGETCVLTVAAKGRQFSPATRVVVVSDDLADVDFAALD